MKTYISLVATAALAYVFLFALPQSGTQAGATLPLQSAESFTEMPSQQHIDVRVEHLAASLGITDCVVMTEKTKGLAAYDGALDCVLLSPDLARYSDDAIRFALAHEHGHRMLGHVQQSKDAQVAVANLYAAASRKPVKEVMHLDQALSASHHARELAADAYARTLLVDKGYSLAGAQELLATTQQAATHPAGATRLHELTRTAP